MKFYCTAEEFYFCKIFSMVRLKSGINKNIQKIRWRGIKKILVIVISIFAFFLFSMYLINRVDEDNEIYVNLLNTIVIGGLVLIGIISFLRLGKEIQYFEESAMNDPVSLKEKVMIYEITDEGIYFNEYNRMNHKDMTIIPWSKVKKIVIEKLNYPMITSSTNSKISSFEFKKNVLEQNIKEVQEKHNEFDCPIQLDHEDKLGMSVYFNSMYYEYLAIPATWGNTNEFVHEIKKHVDVNFEEQVKENVE